MYIDVRPSRVAKFSTAVLNLAKCVCTPVYVYTAVDLDLLCECVCVPGYLGTAVLECTHTNQCIQLYPAVDTGSNYCARSTPRPTRSPMATYARNAPQTAPHPPP